ncbi:MAG: transposase [Solirubrobacterales bacterium]
MPGLNQLKPTDAANSTFHVYNRGIGRAPIFRDAIDRREFIECFRRYLVPEVVRARYRRPYKKLGGEVGVLAYCLLDNHFHLVVHQRTATGVQRLMRGALAGYSRQYNTRYERTGRLFESPYKASLVTEHRYAKELIAYVHTNHPDQLQHPFSSHAAYSDPSIAPWLSVSSGLAIFGGLQPYLDYVASYCARERRR